MYTVGTKVRIISAVDVSWVGKVGRVEKVIDRIGEPLFYALDIEGGHWLHSQLELVEPSRELTLEDKMKDVISMKLSDGTVERLVAEQLESGINHALKDLLGSYGSVTKIIEKQIKSVMVPYLENYDYSKYIVKLDAVLVDVLKNTALENKKILENFKDLMIEEETEREMKVTDLFKRWTKYVAKNVETDGLDIDYDDRVTYESVQVTFEVEEAEGRSWSDMENATIFFECEHDENMNFAIPIHSWKDFDKGKWVIDYETVYDLNSLRKLNEFQIFLMKLKQNYTKLIIDSNHDEEYVTPDKEPEPTFE